MEHEAFDFGSAELRPGIVKAATCHVLAIQYLSAQRVGREIPDSLDRTWPVLPACL